MARILIIEDSSYQRAKICRILETETHEVLQATNGREGLQMILKNTPDCIFLDLIMPEIGGLEVLQNLRDWGLSIPVIVLTADIQETTRRHCLELGATAFVNKPAQETEFRAALAQALSSSAMSKGAIQ